MVSNAPKGASLFGNDYSSFTATIPIEGSRNVRVLVGDIFKGMEKIIPFSIKIITLFHSMFFFLCRTFAVGSKCYFLLHDISSIECRIILQCVAFNRLLDQCFNAPSSIILFHCTCSVLLGAQ